MFNFWRRKKDKALQSVDDRSWTRIFDWTPQAWQTHHAYNTEDSVLSHPVVFACQTTIAGDIAKLPLTMQRRTGKVWDEVREHEYSALYRRPNDYQNAIQFKESWILSKLIHGNTYVLKVREGRRIVALHVLDPLKVHPLEADNGDVFYRLNEDRLSEIQEGQVIVPATEIIHDRFNTLYHRLVGLSPIFAAGAPATIGLTSQKNMENFFANGSNPGGVLTAPGPISESTAIRLKEYWNNNFKGTSSGGIAVAGDGLKFDQMRMSNVDAQVLETLGWSDAKICAVFHVPPYMVGVGNVPAYNNVEALTQAYYSQCLQILIESMEALLDDGLGVEDQQRTQLDIDAGLFRMDSSTLMKALGEGTKNGLLAPDEAREKINQPPVPGGQYPYLQQQNYSLEALA
ncbi:MAG: phage portal protein, partial [Gammaproteobacteria bacterium]|nr:phage portal protein [Gammaproteobacteria bacterium]